MNKIIIFIISTFLIATNISAQTSKKEMSAQRLSWAGVKLTAGNTTIFIDPWISADIWDGEWKKPIVPIEVSTENRFVLITHLHNDHYDPKAIEAAVGKNGRVLTIPKSAPTVAAKGFDVRTVNLWEPYLAGDFVVIPVPAQDMGQEEQVSWIVIGGGKRVIHCGDTTWHRSWYQIGEAFGPFDSAFLPINGVTLLGREPLNDIPASLTPKQAVEAAAILKAKQIVPIHFGMNDPAYYLEFPNAESEFLKIAKEKKAAVELLKEGEKVSWKPNQ